jgi:hypothetical protein
MFRNANRVRIGVRGLTPEISAEFGARVRRASSAREFGAEKILVVEGTVRYPV